MMKSVKKKKKDHSTLFLIAVIVISLLLIGILKVFGTSTVLEANKEEDTLIEAEEPCTVNEHYKVYLGLGEIYYLDDTGYVSNDNSIASVSYDHVIGNQVGTTRLTKNCNTYEVEVTDVITKPIIDPNKPYVPCGGFTKEENDYLDEILATKVKDRGYHTRAGAVEAARFLTMQFPYHMVYFNENGRLPYCDGEGRFYHEGLYLDESRYDVLQASVYGPATWGCSIFAEPLGDYQNNSLDCSGFVIWVLVNGGFDPGDIGAGPMSGSYDCSDLGEHHAITEESLDEVKVGDLFSEEGHIAILMGYKDGIYYIAESNAGIHVRAKGWTKQELINSAFNFWEDMDEFYEYQDGKLDPYWE